MLGTDEVARIMSRRRALLMAAKGAFAITALPAIARAVTSTPPLTQGPYWIDERLNRIDIRSNTSNGAMQAGLPLKLTINVSKIVNDVLSPVVGAWVDIWHCNALGTYSDVAANNTVGQNWLRGYQVTNGRGVVRFTTIYPGWYVGRAVHIHARVRTFSGSTTTFNFTTQFFFDDTVSTHVFTRTPYSNHTGSRTMNAADNIYNSSFTDTDGTVTSPNGGVLKLRLAEKATYAIGSFNIKVRTT